MGTLLTIITVNFNNCDGLELTMSSIIPQLTSSIDYVIIDGGSSDKSVEVIKHYADKLHFWCSEPDGGIYQGMNKGVRHADGQYLLFINSGDELLPGVLQQIEPLLEEGKADIVYGDLYFDYLDKGGLKLEKYPDKITLNFLATKSLPHPGSFIRRKLLEDNPYNEDMRIVSDWEFFVNAIVHLGVSTLHIPTVVSRFDCSGVSTTNLATHDRERSEAHKRLFTPVIQDALEVAKLSDMDCYPEMLRLSKTRRLHRRVKPLLRFVLWIDGLFKHKNKH